MPARPDHFVLQIEPGLVVAAVVVIAVGHGMPGLRGIAAERIERRRAAGAGPQIVAETVIFPAEDQRMGQFAGGEIGAQAVVG